MGDDLIVVDDENESGPSTSVQTVDSSSLHAGSRPKTVAERTIGPLRLRNSTTPSPLSMDNSERTTRSSNTKSKPQPKLKLKLSDKAASQAPGTSFLGQYDRELDSDDEDLAFEEQFILRMPPGEDCDKLKKAVASREVGDDVWFKFKGACLGSLKLDLTLLFYNSRLPSCCIPRWKQSLLCKACRSTVHS
jgi:transcription initiation factor TFIID subunit 7